MPGIYPGAKIVGAYDYDASGERVRKFEGASTAYYITPDYEVRDGVSTFYVRVAGQRVAKIETVDLAGDLLPDATDDGVIDAQDAWIAGQAGGDAALVDSMLQASARRLVAIQDVAGVTYLHPNYLGSATLTTDEAGEVVARAEYFPYGSTRTSEGGVEDYRWAGQETDASGLSYHSARYLVKSLGRWGSADSLFATIDKTSIEKPWEAANRYSYVHNNPINGTDPSGLNDRAAQFRDKVMGYVQEGLNYLGLVEGPVGTAADLASAAISLDQGHGRDAALNLAGALPVLGGALKQALKGIDPAADAGRIGKVVPAPKSLEAFPDAKVAKRKTSVEGGGALRKRWKDDNGNIFEWDSRHGAVEKYNKKGKHQGEYDPKSGDQTKPADPKRKVEP